MAWFAPIFYRLAHLAALVVGGYMMVDPDNGGFKDAEDEYE